MVTHPNLLVAMNEPSLRKFIATVQPGGWIFYNGDGIPEDCARSDVHVLAAQFTHEAHEIGDARAGNMVMLGALLACTNALPQVSVDAALRRLVKHRKWMELDERALERGRVIYARPRKDEYSIV
jgi:Pyruvate/2-oxoacid:ferredoxin oxidoreductase gamma subunit